MRTFVFRNDNGDELGRADTMDEVKQFLLDNTSLREVVVGMPLGIALYARVNRESHEDGEVVLKIGDIERRFSRRTQFAPDGELGVSCEPGGIEVPVTTINIPFRPYADPATNKGIVWVRPGNDAEAHIVLFPAAFKQGKRVEAVQEILTAADKAVQEAVLDRMAA